MSTDVLLPEPPQDESNSARMSKLAILGALACSAGYPYVPAPGFQHGPSGRRMACVERRKDGTVVLQDRAGKFYTQDKKGTIRRIKDENE